MRPARTRICRPVVFAAQEVDLNLRGRDLLRLSGQVVLDVVVIEIARVDPGTGLAVDPPGFAPVRLWSLWRCDPVHTDSRVFVADTRMVVRVVVVILRLALTDRRLRLGHCRTRDARRPPAGDRRIDADNCAKIARMIKGQIRSEIAADRASHVDWPVGLQDLRNRDDGIHDQFPRQAILLLPPLHACRRNGLAVERQVVGNHPELLLQVGILEHVPPLPAVRSRRVLQHNRDALPRFFVVDTVLHPLNPDVDVAPDRGIELPVHILHQALRGWPVQRLPHERHEPHDRAAVRSRLPDRISFNREPAKSEARGPHLRRSGDSHIGTACRHRGREVDDLPGLDQEIVRMVSDLDPQMSVPVPGLQQELTVRIGASAKRARIEPGGWGLLSQR